MAFSGDLAFDPTSHSLSTSSGDPFRFSPPSGSILPAANYVRDLALYRPPLPETQRKGLEVEVDEQSERIQLVEPFPAWDGKDEVDCGLLIKVKGKCSKSTSPYKDIGFTQGMRIDLSPCVLVQRRIIFQQRAHGINTADTWRTSPVSHLHTLFHSPSVQPAYPFIVLFLFRRFFLLRLSGLYSENLLIGAVNAENGKTNSVRNVLTGRWDTVPNVAK